MIKAKHNTFGCWLLFIMAIFFSTFLILEILSHLALINLTFLIKLNDKSFYVISIVVGFFSILFLLLISAHVKNISINKADKEVSIQNIITRQIQTFSFSEFDGIIDTFLTHRTAQYKTIGFVKGKKVVRLIDSFWYSNYPELREGLSSLNYLGTVNFGAWKRIKMLLKLQIIDFPFGHKFGI